MRNIITTTCLAMTLFAGVAMAFDTDLSLDYASKYIWRGQVLSDESVFQPGVSVSMDKFTAGVWANMDLTNDADEDFSFTEVDLSLDYTDTLVEGLDYSVGVVQYDFVGLAHSTTEFYAGLALPELPCAPSVTAYFDTNEAPGAIYINAAAGKSIDIADGLTLDLGASLGYANSMYNNAYWGVDNDGLQDLVLSASVPLEMGVWTMTPGITYVKLMTDDIRNANGVFASDDPDYVYAGVSLSTSF
jgi:uncharacterized protein (TIGR02001 family)